jgi:transposase InsO family protein
LYLAVILELFSRRVVGWALNERLERKLALEAMHMALAQRRPTRIAVASTPARNINSYSQSTESAAA